MVFTVLILIVGFLLLVKGADWFVAGASSIATALKIPSMVIGLTIVAFGTSAPEAAVSITAGISGSNAIAVGNVIGSNIFNLLVVTGISALMMPLMVPRITIRRDFPIATGAAAVLLALTGGTMLLGSQLSLSRIDGIILLVFFAGFMYVTISQAVKSKEAVLEQPAAGAKRHLGMAVAFSLIGLVCVVLGGRMVVDSASDIARAAGVSETLIGLTIVAIGTSLPELVTSIVASMKGETDIAIGNVIGSNIFNIFFILGISAVLHPIAVDMLSVYDMLVMLAVHVGLYALILRPKKIGRPLGAGMVAAYLLYSAYIILR